MIDPNNLTNYTRTDHELWKFWLFCLFVRGNNADVQVNKLEQFLALMEGKMRSLWTPAHIGAALREVKSGQNESLTRAISRSYLNMHAERRGQIRPRWLRIADVEDLERVPGVGPKTARFFLLHSRVDARHAVLDTHLLDFLREREGIETPKRTPVGARYVELERAYLLIADYEGVDPAEMDLAIRHAARTTHTQDWRRFLNSGDPLVTGRSSIVNGVVTVEKA